MRRKNRIFWWANREQRQRENSNYPQLNKQSLTGLSPGSPWLNRNSEASTTGSGPQEQVGLPKVHDRRSNLRAQIKHQRQTICVHPAPVPLQPPHPPGHGPQHDSAPTKDLCLSHKNPVPTELVIWISCLMPLAARPGNSSPE